MQCCDRDAPWCKAYTAGVNPRPTINPAKQDFIAKRLHPRSGLHPQSGFHCKLASVLRVHNRTECKAYTAGEIPTLCVALRVRLRSLPSAQDDISLALRCTPSYRVRSVHGGSKPPPYGCKCAPRCKTSHARPSLDTQARSELIFGTAYGGEMITSFISRKLEARSACLITREAHITFA